MGRGPVGEWPRKVGRLCLNFPTLCFPYTLISLIKHIDSVHEKNKCSTCDFIFSHKNVFENYIKQFLKQRSHTCSICYCSFHWSTVWKSISIQKKKHRCSICDYTFGARGHLKTHIDSVHEQRKSHECSFCRNTFARIAHLKIHVDSVHEKKKSHVCSICDYSSSRKDSLKIHIV